jgi:hypothetical protein
MEMRQSGWPGLPIKRRSPFMDELGASIATRRHEQAENDIGMPTIVAQLVKTLFSAVIR